MVVWMLGHIAEVTLQFDSAIPTKENWKVAKRALRYHIGAKRYGIMVSATIFGHHSNSDALFGLPGDLSIDEEAATQSCPKQSPVDNP